MKLNQLIKLQNIKNKKEREVNHVYQILVLIIQNLLNLHPLISYNNFQKRKTSLINMLI